jgi:hypothetical protein
MGQPVPIDPARFFEFVGSAPVVVVFVSIHPLHAVNPALSGHLAGDGDDEVRFGTVPLAELMLASAGALPYLHQRLRACGAPSFFGVTPGYWLFHGGEMIAWQSGLPAAGDLKAIARSGLLGVIWSGLSRNISFLGEAFQLAASEAAAQRVAGVFRQAVADHRAGRRAPFAEDAAGSPDEILRAYRMLGLRPDASDAEVNEAWRKRRMETHPDRAGEDPAEFERRNRMSAEINLARDVILNQRARPGRRATA